MVERFGVQEIEVDRMTIKGELEQVAVWAFNLTRTPTYRGLMQKLAACLLVSRASGLKLCAA